MNRPRPINGLKYCLMAILGVVFAYGIHQAGHVLAALISQNELQLSFFREYIPFVNRAVIWDDITIFCLAAIALPVFFSIFSSIRPKTRSASKTHSVFWIFYSLPLFVYNVASIAVFFLVKDESKRIFWDVLWAIDNPRFAPAGGFDINTSICLSVVAICAVVTLGVIMTQIRRLRKRL